LAAVLVLVVAVSGLCVISSPIRMAGMIEILHTGKAAFVQSLTKKWW